MIRKKRIGMTMLLIAIISMIILTSGSRYYQRERSTGLETLRNFTHLEAEEIKKFVESDLLYLERIASQVSLKSVDKVDTLAQRLELMGNIGMIERIDMLLPDGRLITATGDVLDVSKQIDYEKIVEERIRVSRQMSDPLDPNRKIVQYYAPIWIDGKAEVVVCGCIDLEEFPRYFGSAAYRGALQFSVIENESANVLMDTWNEAMEKWVASDRKMDRLDLERQKLEISKINQVEGLEEVYIESLQENYYFSYESVGVADWIVVLAAPESVILSQAYQTQEKFYRIGFLLLFVMVVYLVWVMLDARRDVLESESQVENVQYLLDVEHELFNSYAQPERICRALQTICEYTTAEASFFWLLEEDVADRRLWSNAGLKTIASDANPADLFPESFVHTLKSGTLLSYDSELRGAQYNGAQKVIEKRAVSNLMAVVVCDLNGKQIGLLGAYNMKKRWENAKPLEQVSLSFALSIEYYKAYQELARVGHIDELTGLLNRNSYHAALLNFVRENCQMLACIYVDVNGLHELNNHLGHKAGDEMLCQVAKVLKENFLDSCIYRIGGDEFVVLSQNQDRETLEQGIIQTRQTLTQYNYHISVGMEWQNAEQVDITTAVDAAEAAMQEDKRLFYETGGGERQMRNLEQRMTQLVKEKHDTDVFLRTLDIGVEGIYFVDLNTDSSRSIQSLEDVDVFLEQEKGRYSKAIMSYMQTRICPDYLPRFEELCDENYRFLKHLFQSEDSFEFSFLCMDDKWMKLQIKKTEETNGNFEVMWVFSRK